LAIVLFSPQFNEHKTYDILAIGHAQRRGGVNPVFMIPALHHLIIGYTTTIAGSMNVCS